MLPVKTPEARAKILECLRAGHTRKASAQQAGMSHKTLWQWMRDDEELRKDVKKAESESSGALLEMLRVHATQTWQTAAWLLERRDPEWRHPDTKLREKQGNGAANMNTAVQVVIAPADAKRLEAELEAAQLPAPKPEK